MFFEKVLRQNDFVGRVVEFGAKRVKEAGMPRRAFIGLLVVKSRYSIRTAKQ
jgi:hypothetical protein